MLDLREPDYNFTGLTKGLTWPRVTPNNSDDNEAPVKSLVVSNPAPVHDHMSMKGVSEAAHSTAAR